MSGRGHRAVLPPPDYRVEAALAADGLVVTVANHEAQTKTFDFSDLPMPARMQRSLAAAYARQSTGWNSVESAVYYWGRLRAFTRFLADLEQPPQDLDELTPAMLKRWRAQNLGSSGGRGALSVVRVLLRHDPRLASGAVAEELARRVPANPPSKQSYDDVERDRVTVAARQQFRAALTRIRRNTIVLQRWRAGELPADSSEEQLGQILDHVACTGDVPRYPSGDCTGSVRNVKLLGGKQATATWGRLFLTRPELTALAILLCDRFGWNLSVINRMPAPTTAPSAGQKQPVTYLIEVEKRRQGAGRWFATENITDNGADSAGRLITEALEATAHGR